ncbi:CHAT domain-containing protein [Flavobacterium sp. W22_SRS_FP1]|uniref:CHAT domain-containing protein n=1 Tax=Flavobacterium sp. W22_SRS_FP1 TaxID=3240276 RepID=UPI003F91C5B4
MIWYIANPEGFWGFNYFTELLRIAIFVIFIVFFVIFIIGLLISSLISILKKQTNKNELKQLFGVLLLGLVISIFNYFYYAGFSLYISKILSDKYSNLNKTEEYLKDDNKIAAYEYAKSSYEKEINRSEISDYLFLAKLYSKSNFDQKQKLINKYSALISYAYCLKLEPKSISKSESLFNAGLELINSDLVKQEKDNLSIFPTLSLAEINLQKGNYIKAENYFSKLYELNKNSDQEDLYYIINGNMLFADQALRVGDIAKTMRLQLDNLNLYEKTELSKTSSDYLGLLLLAVTSELYFENYEKASDLLLKSIPIAEKKQKKAVFSMYLSIKGSYCYSAALNNRGNELILQNNWWENVKGLFSEKPNLNNELFKEAKKCFAELVQITKSKSGENSPEYLGSLNQLASFYGGIGNYDKAQKIYKEALFILKPNKAANKDLYYSLLLNAESVGLNKTSSQTTLEEIEDYYYKKLSDNYIFLTEDEKVSFSLNTEKRFDIINSIYITKGNEKSGASLYNNILALKNIALYSNQNIREYLNIANASLKKNYLSLLQEKEKLLYTNLNSKEIEFNLNLKQKSLIEQITSDPNYHFIDPKAIKWWDIKNSLDSKEVAIEIINIPLNKPGKNDRGYFALFIKNNSNVPEVIPLFLESELSNVLNQKGNTEVRINSIYQQNKEVLINLIWKKIENKITPNDKVYLSVSGLLHTISFPALLNEKKVDVTYLGSTKELIAAKKEVTKSSNIALFGDINYGENKNGENLKSQNRNGTNKAKYTLLPYSKNEVNGIKLIFEDASEKKISLFSQNVASEENFRQLNFQKFDIIHIATHGFYDSFGNLISGNNDDSVDNVLLKSGLVFSNVNNKSANTKNDGLLNSFEISQLDLSGVDLIVLSACETGLGSIKGSEGIFGLQRAFKLAGVNSMIVSLWQVPDKSTSELMVSFYKFYLDGFSKKESLFRAQKEIKNKYKLPFYWAGFMLVE